MASHETVPGPCAKCLLPPASGADSGACSDSPTSDLSPATHDEVASVELEITAAATETGAVEGRAAVIGTAGPAHAMATAAAGCTVSAGPTPTDGCSQCVLPAPSGEAAPQGAAAAGGGAGAGAPPSGGGARWRTELQQLKSSEDWYAVYIGLTFYAIVWIAARCLQASWRLRPAPWGTGPPPTASSPSTAAPVTAAAPHAISLSFAGPGLVFLALALAAATLAHCGLRSVPLRRALCSFVPAFGVVATFALLALVLGSHAALRRWSLGSAVWALFIPLALGTASLALRAPGQRLRDWLRPAASAGEFYIKIGLVCLVTDLYTLGRLGSHALIVAFGVPPVILCLALGLGRAVLPRQLPLALTLGAGVAICGASACTAAATVVGASKQVRRALPFPTPCLTPCPAHRCHYHCGDGVFNGKGRRGHFVSSGGSRKVIRSTFSVNEMHKENIFDTKHFWGACCTRIHVGFCRRNFWLE